MIEYMLYVRLWISFHEVLCDIRYVFGKYIGTCGGTEIVL